MPFDTEIRRNGAIVGARWDYRMLSAFMTAAASEACPDELDKITEGIWSKQRTITIEDQEFETYIDFSMVPIYYLDWDLPLLKKGRQVLFDDHTYYFMGEKDDNSDKRTFRFLAGDELRARRTFKDERR